MSDSFTPTLNLRLAPSIMPSEEKSIRANVSYFDKLFLIRFAHNSQAMKMIPK